MKNELIGYVTLITAFLWFAWSCAEVATNSIILSHWNFWNIYKELMIWLF